jgi:sugar phosphate isomerase/epimerase
MRTIIIYSLVACAFLVSAVAEAVEQCLSNPFYAFQDGLVGVPLKEQPKLLKELGYDGIEYEGELEQLPDMLDALDAQHLKLFCIYTEANVDPSKPPYKPGLKAAIERLKGRDVVITPYVVGGKPSSEDSDDRAVAVLREIADMAAKSGLRVALYPHLGVYVARVEDGLRLVKKVQRDNVGVCFNLCHFLKLDSEKNLEQRMREAMPHVFIVTINGADSGDTQQMDWNRLIQPLDRGTFDVGRVLRTLRELKYTGPIGLQCFAIPGAPRDHLSRSMKAWQKLKCLDQTCEEGFTPVFNGKDLTGWEGEPGYWSVEDGAITGSTVQKKLDHATYLYWRGGQPADFELRTNYRFVNPDGNSGINFRSQELPRWDVKGYQADMETGPNYSGILYECNQREIMTQRGQKVVIVEDGKREVTALPVVDWSKVIRPGQWNEYVVIARGPEIILKINGAVASHVIDHERGKAAASGLITLQVHPGPPMKVQFKNLRIKILKDATS